MDNEILENLRKEVSLLNAKVKAYESDLEKLIKTRESAVLTAVKDGRKEIENSFNKKLVELDSILKKNEKKKEKEKKKIIDEKIERGTKDKRESVYYLKRNIKTIIKEKNISPLVNTKAFFYLVAPYGVADHLKGILIILIIIIVLPTFVVFFKGQNWTIWEKVMLYICNIFIWGLLYLGFTKITKCDEETIREIREIRKDIRENEKDIERVTADIKKEKIEGENEYTKIDREVESINLDIKNLKEKEKEALDNFDNVTSNEIKNKIEKEAAREIKDKENDIKKAKKEYDKKLEEYEKAKTDAEKEPEKPIITEGNADGE